MKKIQRYVFTMACLLTGLGGYADSFKINELNVTYGTLTAKMGSTDITAGTTDIPFNTVVTLTVTPNSGYYLQSLTYEEVTDLGQAQAPQHRAPDPEPVFQTIHSITLQHPEAYFGGEYTFYMPNNNVIITATCIPLTNFSESFPTVSLGDSPITYDGYVHPLVVKAGEISLTQGNDFKINSITLTQNETPEVVYEIRRAGSYVVEIEGIGKYKGTRTSDPLTITKKDLTITAHNQTYTYSVGGAIQTGTGRVTTSGLVSDDALTSITLTQSTFNAAEAPGTITPSAAATDYGITNYNVTYVEGSLTINPLPVGETATGTKAVVTLTGPSTDTGTDVLYYNHNGSIQRPTVTVTHLSNTLVENTDYALVFTAKYFPSSIDYIKADIYTITVNFTGNYSGSLSTEYQIRKKVELNNATDFRWSTYYDSNYNMEISPSEKFKAYTISAINSNTVEIAERNYIKAGIPMLLYKKGTDDYSYPPLVKTVPDWGTMVDFYKANTTERDVTEIQTAEGGKEIWILVRDQFVRTKSGNVPANKCYLALGSSTSYPSPMLISSNPTGIDLNTTKSIDLNGIWYTIDGRELHGIPTEKGIYITNGKKIIIK